MKFIIEKKLKVFEEHLFRNHSILIIIFTYILRQLKIDSNQISFALKRNGFFFTYFIKAQLLPIFLYRSTKHHYSFYLLFQSSLKTTLNKNNTFHHLIKKKSP